ncbi:MAG: DUF4270 domain-containing protein [Mediterranea sp.]|jgi:hypothetical protein|nr:DUF4270 domain-containing protein [Mediterranea sp.]
MKAKYTGLMLLAAGLTFFGCDDNTGALGIGMLPDTDSIKSHTTYFDVQTRSFLADSVFARTSTGYVGHFTDPKSGFGRYEASFLTELNCTDEFKFPEVYHYDSTTKKGYGMMAGDSVVAAQLVVFYSSWYGDSLNACRLSAYTLDKRVQPNRYTNFDPTQYYKPSYSASDPGLFVVHRAFTAYDTSVPDSIRNATNSSGTSTYYPNVTFPLSKEFGNWMLKENRNNPEKFKDSDTFINEIFKGVYIKNTYGDGTVLYVDRVDLQMQFRFHYTDSLGVALKKKTDGTDSLYYSTATVFASTKEVVQANRFINSDEMKQMAAQTEHTYLKSPAGIFTEAVVPYDEIDEALKGDTLNAVRLTFTGYRQETGNSKFTMNPPSTVLLLRKKDLEKFFEGNEIPNSSTSFYTVRSNNQYVFNNIARLVTATLNEKPGLKKAAQQSAGANWNEEEWEKNWQDENNVLLIPVKLSIDNSNQNQTVITGIQHDLTPGYVKLKGGEKDLLTLEVVHTSFK